MDEFEEVTATESQAVPLCTCHYVADEEDGDDE